MLGFLSDCQIRSACSIIDRDIVGATVAAKKNVADTPNRTSLLQFAKSALFQIAADINMTRDPRTKRADAVDEQIGASDHFQYPLHGAFPEHRHLGLRMIKKSRNRKEMGPRSVV